jgi:3',5'-cyclic AMP phosphodiesterase CpdA
VREGVFVLAHLSDPHLAPLPRPRIAELASKRLTGYVNWLRKRRAVHRSEVLATITRDLARARPDHIAVTGDLVNIALPAEFERARRWLEALGTPAEVSLVPGNHDAYEAGADLPRARHWAPYMTGDAATVPVTDSGDRDRPLPQPQPSPHRGEGAETFPFLRIRGPVALVGVSTAVPTPPFMAAGRLGAPQIGRMAALLAGAAGQFRVVLIHHPPHGVPKAHLKRLLDAAAFRDAIATAGAELVIHGHDHVRSRNWIDGPGGRVPVIGVPSASAAFGTDHDPAGYNLYRIGGRPGAWSCEVSCRSLDAAGAVIEGQQFAT